MTPKRIQMSRQHPWRADNPDAVIVDRRTKWGNPYKVDGEFVIRAYEDEMHFIGTLKQSGRITPAVAVILYQHLWLTTRSVGDYPSRGYLDLRELRGRDVACWCPLDQPCHGDVLLELANAPENGETR